MTDGLETIEGHVGELVNRLRAMAHEAFNNGGKSLEDMWPLESHNCWIAADTLLSQQREIGDKILEMGTMDAKIIEQQREIERLRSQLKHAQAENEAWREDVTRN